MPIKITVFFIDIIYRSAYFVAKVVVPYGHPTASREGVHDRSTGRNAKNSRENRRRPVQSEHLRSAWVRIGKEADGKRILNGRDWRYGRANGG